MNLSISSSKGTGPTVRMSIICLIGLIAFVLFAVYPNIRKSEALDQKGLDLEAQIEKQKILNPLYHQIKGGLDKMKESRPESLPMPTPTQLAQPEIHNIQSEIEGIVRETGLRVDVIKPEVNTLIDNTNLMRVYMSVTGDFGKFRELFLTLAKAMPSLSHVEKIDIDRVEGSQNLKLQMVLWLAKVG